MSTYFREDTKDVDMSIVTKKMLVVEMCIRTVTDDRVGRDTK
jgi:hypothetical protein